MHPLGYSTHRRLADCGARVCQKSCPRRNVKASSLGFSLTKLTEPVAGAAVGDDVEEPQKLSMEPPIGGNDAGQEGVPGAGGAPSSM